MTPVDSLGLSDPKDSRGGYCVWLTGISAAGKSTIANHLAHRLAGGRRVVEVLDGDAVRSYISPELGFSRGDRDLNVKRVAWVASRLVRAEVAVVVALMSPFAEGRRYARSLIEDFGPFIEVLVDTPVEVCIERDPKGLYRRALAGELTDMVGLDIPYEHSQDEVVRIVAAGRSPGESASEVLSHLASRGLI